jgi:hypothetical protein
LKVTELDKRFLHPMDARTLPREGVLQRINGGQDARELRA